MQHCQLQAGGILLEPATGGRIVLVAVDTRPGGTQLRDRSVDHIGPTVAIGATPPGVPEPSCNHPIRAPPVELDGGEKAYPLHLGAWRPIRDRA